MSHATRRPVALLTSAAVLVLVAVEAWVLSLPLLADMPAPVPAGWSARDASLLLDLLVLAPLLTLVLVRVWRRPGTTPGGALPGWLRSWLRPRRLLYLLLPPLFAVLMRSDLGWGEALTAVAGLAVLLEVLAFGVLAVKVAQVGRATRAARRAGHSLPTALGIATGQAFGDLPIVPALRLATLELAQVYYLTCGWLRRPTRPGQRAFTHHRRRDETVLVAIAIIITIETVPVHVVVHQFSALVAWILTGLHAYSLIWTLGVLAAARQRPVVLGDGWLRLTDGLWSEAVVAVENLRSVTDARAVEALPAPDASFGPRSDVLLELERPVLVHGAFGRAREARTLTLALDEPGAFLKALQAARR